LSSANGRVDAVNGLTRAVPISLVQQWFGLTDSDPQKLFEWSYWNQMDAFWNQPFDAINGTDPNVIIRNRISANEEMKQYLVGLVTRRVQEIRSGNVGSDSVSRLITLSLSGALKFDIARLVLNIGGLLIGTVETTFHAAVNALSYLMEDGDRMMSARQAALSNLRNWMPTSWRHCDSGRHFPTFSECVKYRRYLEEAVCMRWKFIPVLQFSPLPTRQCLMQQCLSALKSSAPLARLLMSSILVLGYTNA
jgi:cytochrome P450